MSIKDGPPQRKLTNPEKGKLSNSKLYKICEDQIAADDPYDLKHRQRVWRGVDPGIVRVLELPAADRIARENREHLRVIRRLLELD